MKIKLVTIFLLLLGSAQAQSSLDIYIKEGIKNNIVLQHKNIALEKALYDLKEANSLFLPSVNFNSSYMSGNGGRYLSFPLGDLMNPVYQTLNELTETSNFQKVENQEFYFNPNNYYDAHIRSSIPIINTELIYNKSIKKEQAKLQQYEVDIYKRELVKNIKISYYNYLSALSAVKILESAEKLVNKNLEVNKSLLKNGKGLHASVLRTESEVEMIKVELTNARNQVINASRYFNFLLNKSLTEQVEADSSVQNIEEISIKLSGVDVRHREELKQAETGEKIYGFQNKLTTSYWTPKISAFFDLGSQGADMEISNKSRYYLIGAQLDIPIFNGFKNSYRIRKSKLDVKAGALNSQNVVQQLELSADLAKNNLNSAFQEYRGAQKQLASAKSYFRLIETGFNEGTNSLIEYLDARNQLTSSELKLTITTFKVLQAEAMLERETAAFAFN